MRRFGHVWGTLRVEFGLTAAVNYGGRGTLWITWENPGGAVGLRAVLTCAMAVTAGRVMRARAGRGATRAVGQAVTSAAHHAATRAVGQAVTSAADHAAIRAVGQAATRAAATDARARRPRGHHPLGGARTREARVRRVCSESSAAAGVAGSCAFRLRLKSALRLIASARRFSIGSVRACQERAASIYLLAAVRSAWSPYLGVPRT